MKGELTLYHQLSTTSSFILHLLNLSNGFPSPQHISELVESLSFQHGGGDDAAVSAGAMDIEILVVFEVGHGAGVGERVQGQVDGIVEVAGFEF